MIKEKFPQGVFGPANSIIALKRQGGRDFRLKKRKIELSEQLEKHPDEMRIRISRYISSKSRVTAGGGPNKTFYRRS